MDALPHSEETERAVLASVLLDPMLCAEMADSLQAEAFYLERHQVVFSAFVELGDNIDLRTVQASLERSGKFELVGGFAYLSGMDMDLPDLERFRQYVAVVRRLWADRRLLEVADQIRASVAGGKSPGETIAEAEKALAEVERGQLEAGNVEAVGDLSLDLQTQKAGELIGVSAGLHDLNRTGGGWRPGHLITLAGATGMGKTSLALCFAVSAAKAGARTLIISIEMGEEEVMKRCLSIVTQIPHEMIDLGHVPNARISEIVRGQGELCGLPLWVCDDPQTPQSIAATARRHRAQHGLDLLVVDYLGLVEYAGAKQKTHEQLGEMAWSLKMLAKSLEVPVIMLHQLSRGVEKRSPPRPILADLRDSGHVENHSDRVVFVYRPGYYKDDDRPGDDRDEIIIAKNRGGRTGKVEVAWVGETMTFRDLARNEGGNHGW